MISVKKIGENFDFVDSGDVAPLEPERAEKIKEGYRKARKRQFLQKALILALVILANVLVIYFNLL